MSWGLSPWDYYPFNDNDFADHSGNGHHGTPVDGPATILDSERGWVAAFNVAPTKNEWQHLAGTCDGSTSRIYINGRVVGEGSGGFSANTAAGANVVLGFGEDGSDYDESFNGCLDDVYIFSQAISEQEVRLVMAGLSPELASGPSPADRARDVPRDVVLSWKPGEFARTHDVYFGVAYDDVNSASRTSPKGLLARQDQDANSLDASTVYIDDIRLTRAAP